MPMRWRAFSLPKKGHVDDEYEDASAGDAERGRFAVADGASESSFASLWAGLLAAEFVRAPLGRKRPWANWLPPLRDRWAQEIGGRELPWYAEEKLRLGAFATLVGLVVGKAHWRAVAIGDSCLFHVRQGRLLHSFPVSRSEEFGNNPRLVGSRTPAPDAVQQQQVRAHGAWQPNDQFLLMTDALAQWFLQQVEGGNKPWEVLDRLLDEPEDNAVFASWIDGLRGRGRLRNDDVTLVAVDLNGEARPAGESTP
ncbi:MAG TPA: protein phosphatase 2C domain-containing protein [Gemmataceae bacterium]|nr:protein phosphatase 2C domain-containing protein [Gemmataceae bacterium]